MNTTNLTNSSSLPLKNDSEEDKIEIEIKITIEDSSETDFTKIPINE